MIFRHRRSFWYTACGFWDTGLKPTPPERAVEVVAEPPPNWWTPLVSSEGSGKVLNGPGTASIDRPAGEQRPAAAADCRRTEHLSSCATGAIAARERMLPLMIP